MQENTAYAAWAAARISRGESPRDREAFVRHLEALGVPDPTDAERYGFPWLPPGVEWDAFGEWREACKVNRSDYTDREAFVRHLEALGADTSDLHRWGYPRSAPYVAEEPPPQTEMLRVMLGDVPDVLKGLRCLQVWQNFADAQVAAICTETGMNAVAVKALDGLTWMGSIASGNPNSAEMVKAQRVFYNALGIRYGVWVNPLYGPDTYLEQQAEAIAEAANQAQFLCIDSEPYPSFWGANRPVGAANYLMTLVRARLNPDIPILWQPDPRPERLAEIRAEEWALHMDAWAGQHYFSEFGTPPDLEAEAAFARASAYGLHVVIPTFSANGVRRGQLAKAVRAARERDAYGFIIWRYGLANLSLLLAEAVSAWL